MPVYNFSKVRYGVTSTTYLATRPAHSAEGLYLFSVVLDSTMQNSSSSKVVFTRISIRDLKSSRAWPGLCPLTTDECVWLDFSHCLLLFTL